MEETTAACDFYRDVAWRGLPESNWCTEPFCCDSWSSSFVDPLVGAALNWLALIPVIELAKVVLADGVWLLDFKLLASGWFTTVISLVV